MAKKWIQKANAKMRRNKTTGSFGRWCKKQGYKDGCDPACIAAAKKAGGKIAKKAIFAQNTCRLRKR